VPHSLRRTKQAPRFPSRGRQRPTSSSTSCAARPRQPPSTGLPTPEVADTYRRYIQEAVLAREAEIDEPALQAVLDMMREEQLLSAAPSSDWYVDRSYWLQAQADLAR